MTAVATRGDCWLGREQCSVQESAYTSTRTPVAAATGGMPCTTPLHL